MAWQNSLKVQKIPVPPGSDHLPPPHGQGLLPTHEFTMGLIAAKGLGKTTTAINFIMMNRDYFHRILIISPSIRSDVKWKFLMKQELLVENKPLKDWCNRERMKAEEDKIVQNNPVGNFIGSILDKKFSKIIPPEDFIDECDPYEFMKIMEENRKIVTLLDEQDQLKTLADRILVILDDQVGSDFFVGPVKKLFVGFNTRHRHYSASVLMMAQAYKEVPKTIRTNFTCVLVYRTGNQKELEVIYEEFQMGLNYKDWLRLYDHATSDEHGFMFIDLYCKDKRLSMRKGFDVALAYLELRDKDRDEESTVLPSKKRKLDDKGESSASTDARVSPKRA